MKLFYSYCHEDEGVLRRIRQGIKVIIENAEVEEWWDRKLRGSDNLYGEIETALENADIVVMLLSDAYLASESCRKEMEYALRENEKWKKISLPIVIRECGWREVEDLKNVVAIPKDGKALGKWKPVDAGIADIRESMKAVFEKAAGDKQGHERYTRFLQGIKEIEFISQKKRDVELNEIFVFPNLSLEMEESSQSIHNFGELWECGNKVLLIGEQRSGKTTLCHKITLDLTEKGEGVLVVKDERQVGKKGVQWIRDLCKEQTLGGHRTWRHFTRKTLIFDNAEAETDFSFLASAEREFDRIIIATEEEDYICGLSTNTGLAEYVVIRMAPLKHGQQEELIRKWLRIGGEGEIEDHRVDGLERDVNLIIQENRIVPRFPFFVLSILQTYEALMPQRMDITGYGHCYQALITAQLAAEGIEVGDIDSAHKVLTEIAYAIFNRAQQTRIPSVKLTDFLEEYTSEYIVRPGVVERLYKGGRLLRLDENGECIFKYGFVYYFFLGKYIAGNYLRAKSIIEKLCEHSYRRENAYTLIFTAHHTTDEDLIDTILINTMLATGSRKEATLESAETEILAEALSSIPNKIAKSHSAVKRNREDERAVRDRDEEQQDTAEEEELGRHDIYRSLKNMDILGQILRNRYGSLRKKMIEDIAEAITGSGLCLVGDFTSEKRFRILERYIEEAAKHPATDSKHRETEQVLRKRFGRKLRMLCFAIVTLLMGRIVYAIEKPELASVISTLCQRKDNVAHRIIEGMFRIRTRGILTNEDIDQIDAIIKELDAKGNEVARRILSIWLQLYLSTHKVRFDHRQRIMKVLKLEYSPNKPKLDR